MKRMQNKEIGFKKQRICIGIDAHYKKNGWQKQRSAIRFI